MAHVAQSIVGSGGLGETELGVGCERYCKIDFNQRDIEVKERIFAYEAGSFYTYDVYEWTNFPLSKSHNTFGVAIGDHGETVPLQLRGLPAEARVHDRDDAADDASYGSKWCVGVQALAGGAAKGTWIPRSFASLHGDDEYRGSIVPLHEKEGMQGVLAPLG